MTDRLDRWADPPLLVLASLAEEPKHGYAITQDVAQTMGVRLTAGTLYAVISRLEAGGLIEPLEPEGRRRPYRITAAGAQALAYLEESGAGSGELASLLWRAAPAWAWPPAHLHDPPARMRASLATILMAWSALAVLGGAFDQLTQQQGIAPAGHPVIGWSYAIFGVALALSALVLGAGCLPLWLLMLRRARRDHSPRATACLLTPVAAPVAGLLALALILGAVGHPGGVGPWWFLAITMLGFATAAMAAAGPGIALRTQRPRGPAVRLAAVTAAIATATIIVAFAASALAAIGLYLWAHQFAGYHNGVLLGTYLAVVAAAGATAAVSATRGTYAALAR